MVVRTDILEWKIVFVWRIQQHWQALMQFFRGMRKVTNIFPGIMGDFWEFDIAGMKWTALSQSAPFANAARYGLGLTAEGFKVNLFGGRGVDGG